MKKASFLVRLRGVVSGPYDLGQLQTMRRLEQLARFHEVSVDGKTWVAASTVAAIFPAPVSVPEPTRGPAAQVAERIPEVTLAVEPRQEPTPSSWFYARGEEYVGPISLDELQYLIALGELTHETLVWAEGMANWLPFSDIATTSVNSRTLPTAAHCSQDLASEPRADLADRSMFKWK
jgi:GYF domain 2